MRKYKGYQNNDGKSEVVNTTGIHSFNALIMAMTVLVKEDFTEFKNEENCTEFLKIFSDLIEMSKLHDPVTLFEKNLFTGCYLVTFAGALPTDESKIPPFADHTLNMDDFIGSFEENHIKAAQGLVAKIIETICSAFVEASKSVRFTREKKIECSFILKTYVEKCGASGFVNKMDYDKWIAEVKKLEAAII